MIWSPQTNRRNQYTNDLDTLRQDAHPGLPAWIINPFVRVITFVLGVLAILAIAALLLPSAIIQLQPESLNQNISVSVTASPEINKTNLSGLIPVQWHSVIVEGRAQIDSSGKIFIPDQLASGHVLFTNLSDRDTLIPVGTAVSTLGDNPVRFVTTEEIILAALTLVANQGVKSMTIDRIASFVLPAHIVQRSPRTHIAPARS